LRGFGTALDCAVGSSESRLARMMVAREIRVLGRHADLVERLADAREQPWVALREAIEVARD